MCSGYILCYYIVIEKECRRQYRRTREPEIDDIPDDGTMKTIEENIKIMRYSGSHSSTHLNVDDKDIPSLRVVAHRPTHLRIRGITKSTQLQRYIYMSTH